MKRLCLALLLLAAPAQAQAQTQVEAQPVTGLFVEASGETALTLTAHGLVSIGLHEPKLAAARIRQSATGETVSIEVHESGADAPVRGLLELSRNADGGFTLAAVPHDYLGLRPDDRLRPVAGLDARCLAPITEAAAFHGDYIGLLLQQHAFTLSDTEMTLPAQTGQTSDGDPVELEPAKTIAVQTTLTAPDRLTITHPDGDLAVDHLGLRIATAAAFGPRGRGMRELYPLATDISCISEARDRAQEATR
ncbi:hypothetical protein [Oceanicola sp. 502str15]|uniref:hypothetical protein n=1 Tax=Oceanicola sp. 502str15 TaxID=2696061 RepID=UPI0020955F6E|nr:hypothetical protein [Oceanicola sp. 502str15]MCO6382864.1 hypothetical protein [Oceanicola sp. 502str15]